MYPILKTDDVPNFLAQSRQENNKVYERIFVIDQTKENSRKAYPKNDNE